MKSFLLICAGLLFLAVTNMPIGYYNLLRISVTFGAGMVIIKELKNGVGLWVIIFGFTAVLFNPIFPIYLVQKENWLPIDIISGVLFLIKGLSKEKEKYGK